MQGKKTEPISRKRLSALFCVKRTDEKTANRAKRFGKCVRSQKQKIKKKGAFGKSGVQKKNQFGGTPFISAIPKNRVAVPKVHSKGLGAPQQAGPAANNRRWYASYG